ncbi:molybdopterin converting factor subunit 1 [Pelagibacterium flavum]|uniref:Molybdopterin converting factor subunit 1 n=1 Tax=Pelagibacterium flavum TaxID=2984530 RepID=A0ABY6IRU1_9HYPH|nr:molybdopterin converting factor subunit 1 [Pelagibacterium sp. YIM 151497]MAN77115.1 molybdopterin converting factor subunit 1 [Hyphomicrobiales bacterium]UYQ73324.1 molybdopterin converting factor subunit 1 [Pelagibacterium sp. YIM 151497]|tara:strand:+ start:651 stop:902 length:252 start_codon:yes stop_codon:yes gene_type:complete
MKILYFAWLRERLGRDSDEVVPPNSVATIADLIEWLASRDEGFALATANRKLIRAAIDDELVEHETPLQDAKTVALFPPMTGG